jgi:uncharacterized protein (DUF952 family)
MAIKRFSPTERSPRVQPIGKIFKGSPKVETKRFNRKTGQDEAYFKVGENLDYFRFVPTAGVHAERVQEIWDQFYGDKPKEIQIFFKHTDIDNLIDDWYSEFATGGLLKVKCDGETITEWRDDRGVYHLNEPKPCRAPNSPKGCDKCRASALIKFGMPEFRYMGYSGNVEISTTSINDIVFLKAQLAEIAAELALCGASLKYAPLILSRSPRVITKTTAQKQFRGEENLLYLSIDPQYQQKIDRAISAAKYAEIGATYEPRKLANVEAIAQLPPAIDVSSKPVWSDFFSKFCGLCDRCQTDEQLEKMIGWTFSQEAYKAYPENHRVIEEAIAIVQARLQF